MSKIASKNALDPLAASISKRQQTHRIWPQLDARTTQTLVVGVSGGADSICLLHLLWSLTNVQPSRWPFVLHVAHFDHGLRADADADAEFVREVADLLAIPCTVERAGVDLASQKGGVENAARQARYNFLGRVAVDVTPPEQDAMVAVAHNADDQAETVLMNFLRGSGLDGLGGMSMVSSLPVSTDRPVKLVRPLLETPRAEIVAYLARHNLRWREDGSNSDKRFLRNRLRHDVMPLLKEINPDLLQTLGRNAEIVRAEAIRVNALDTVLLDTVLLDTVRLDDVTVGSGTNDAVHCDAVNLDLAQLCNLDRAVLRNVVRLALHRVCYADSGKKSGSYDSRNIGFDVVEKIVTAVRSTCEQQAHGASGPHPVVNDICWTLLPANEFCVATLSLHRKNALPMPVDHPRVEAQMDLARIGCAESANGWTLRSSTLPVEDLPVDWRTQGAWSVFLTNELVAQPRLASLVTVCNASLQFAPLGMNGARKSSLGDFFTDRKIAPALRPTWPLLLEGQTGRVLWVCGLQPAHDARITDATKRVLHLRWEKSNAHVQK